MLDTIRSKCVQFHHIYMDCSLSTLKDFVYTCKKICLFLCIMCRCLSPRLTNTQFVLINHHKFYCFINCSAQQIDTRYTYEIQCHTKSTIFVYKNIKASDFIIREQIASNFPFAEERKIT